MANDFNVDLYQFPSDNEYYEHYIRIDILETTTQDQATPNNVPGSANFQPSQGQVNGLLAAGGATAGYGIGRTVGGENGGLLGGVGGGLSGAATSQLDVFQTRGTRKLAGAIEIPMTQPPSVKYSMSFSNKDLGSLIGFLGQAGESISGSGSYLEMLKSLGSVTGEAAGALMLNVASLPGQLSGLADIRGAIGAATRTATNPFKEVLFEAVDFRTFSINTRIMPRSSAETEIVKNMIDRLKKYMHPTLSSNKLFFVYPADFEISYWFRTDGSDSPNGYMHRIAPCALTDMTVTYGSDIVSSFKNGAPTEVNISLQFTEKEILTQQSMDAGY